MYLLYTIWYFKMCEYCEMAQLKLTGISIHSQMCVCMLDPLSHIRVCISYYTLLCTIDFQNWNAELSDHPISISNPTHPIFILVEMFSLLMKSGFLIRM